MPYISQEDRDYIDSRLSFHDGYAKSGTDNIKFLADMLKNVPSGKVKGAFNYFVSRLFLNTFSRNGYTDISDALRVFEDMNIELTRRLMNPIEDIAIVKNGDLPELESEVPKKYYYKIVRKYENKLLSFRFTYDPENSIEYKMNEWTKPVIPNSKLYVFDDLDAAKEFFICCRTTPYLKKGLYKCEVVNPTKDVKILYDSYDVSTLWNGTAKKHWLSTPPDCSVGVDAVKLIEQIQ